MNSVPNSSDVAFSRRRFLGTAFAGTAATLAGAASMSFFAAEPALAQSNLTPDEALKTPPRRQRALMRPGVSPASMRT